MSGPPISDPAAALWLAYRQAVAAGRPRAEVTAALEQLIAALGDADRTALTAWFFRERYDRNAVALPRGSAIALLSREVLVPALLAGARAGDADHLRWLAFALRDWSLRLHAFAPELYERSHYDGVLAAALARNPDAGALWWRIFEEELDGAYWFGHHMDEGILLAPEAECRAFLADARAVAAAAPAGALSEDDLAELAELEAVYAVFFAWRAAGSPGTYGGPTPKWTPAIPPHRRKAR